MGGAHDRLAELLRKWPAKRLFLVEDQKNSVLDYEKMESAGKWIAAGFTALAALLSFLGIGGDVLDGVLRAAPSEALFAFALIGAGLLLGLLAPAFDAERQIYLGWLLGSVGVLWIVTAFAITDLGAPGITWRQIVAGIVLVLILVLTCRVAVSVLAAALVAAVMLTATGLYAAAQIAIASKLPVGSPQVTASLNQQSSTVALQVSVRLSRAENQLWWLIVRGFGQNQQEAILGRARLDPDTLGTIDRTTVIPLGPPRAWDFYSVRLVKCESAAKTGNCREDGYEDEFVSLTGAQ